MADKEEKTEAPSKGSEGGGKLPLILGAVNTLMLAGVLGLLVLRPAGAARQAPPEHAAEARAEAPPEKTPERKAPDKAGQPGPTVKFPDFVVHLRDPDVDHYARLAIEIEVADEKAKEAVTARLPQIRDSFIAYLSDRTTSDLRGSEAIGRAKSDLSDRLKAVAPELAFRGLYMTELVVQ
jgi:flagellar FliL protein